MATNLARFEAIWLRNPLVGLFRIDLDPIVIHYNNHSSINLFENLVFHNHSKNIKIHYHNIMDIYQRGIARLQ